MGKREPSVEYLTFLNHTECHCVDRRRSTHSPTTSSMGTAAGAEATQPDSSGLTSANTVVRGIRANCTCVKHFEVFFDFEAGSEADTTDREVGSDSTTESDDDGSSSYRNNQRRCRCDCHHGNTSCEWLKRGKDGFTIEDRR